MSCPTTLLARSAVTVVAISFLAGCGGAPTASLNSSSPSGAPRGSAEASSSSHGASLVALEGLAIDRVGRVYVSDFDGNHIFRIEDDRSLTIVAGNGTSGLAEDGVTAVDASLGEPAGIAFGPGGELFLMDHHNHRVREVDASGIITTVVGGGPTGRGNGSFAGDGGPAVAARIFESVGIAFDAAGNLYIADSLNQRIRRVDGSGIITTFAGNGGPSGITPIEDGSRAVEVPLLNPWYLAVDPKGDLAFSDVGLNAILRMDTDGLISKVPVDVRNPNGVGFDAEGNLYVADTDNQRILEIAADGTVRTIAGTGTAGFSGDGGPAIEAQIHDPFDLAVDAAANIYFVDGGNRRVRMISAAGVITTIAGG